MGVSWYEAVAFCRWLSDATGKDIMLPTIDQWQYAAQGNDYRTYPWGNVWDGGRCNNSVDPYTSNVTSAVTKYEGKGDSPFGVVDMSGNVREWCWDTDDIDGIYIRSLCGGCWYEDIDEFFRCDYGDYGHPFIRLDIYGFRIIRS